MLTWASEHRIWRTLTADQLESQYRLVNHPDRTSAYARLAALSASVRQEFKWHAINYGAHARQRIELFEGTPNSPVLAFVHGGYWRGLEMETFSCVARPFVERGVWVANIEYPLAPEASLTEITHSCIHALRRSADKVSQLGGDGSRMVVSGHSAGGHLATAALVADKLLKGEAPLRLCGSVPISGLFDLEPLRHISLNDTLALTQEEALQLSPIRVATAGLAPVLVAVGGDETEEFQRQSRDYAKRIQAAGGEARLLVIPGLNHFTVLNALCDPSAELFRETLALLQAPGL
jgi:arylformamidase